MKTYCNSIKQVCMNMKSLIFLKMHTEYHKKAWQSFEKVLVYRCILFTFFSTSFKSILCITGTSIHQISYKQVKNGEMKENFNKELFETLYPYVEFLIYFFIALNTILICAAMKKHSICKSFFFLLILNDLVYRLLPYDLDWELYMYGIFFNTMFNFVGSFFNFWISLICSVGYLAF